MSKKKLITVRVTDREYEWLVKESERLQVSISELVRDLVRKKMGD